MEGGLALCRVEWEVGEGIALGDASCMCIREQDKERGRLAARAANTLRKLCSLVRSRGVGRDEAEGVDG